MPDASLIVADSRVKLGSRKLRSAVYLLAFAGGMMASFPVTIFSGFERIQTDEGDAEQLHFVLEHTWLWISDSGYHATFWSPPMFYPAPHTMTYSENLIGTAPIYWALRLGCNEDVSLQGWILIVVALNYWAMLVVLRWFGVHPLLAVLGGFIFAFGLPRQAQAGSHLHLLPQAFGPFAVYYTWKLFHQPTRLIWALALLSVSGQLLASVYLGWFLAFALAIWIVFLAFFDFTCIKRLGAFVYHNRVFVAITIALSGACLYLFFQNYYIGNRNERRDYLQVAHMTPPISHWFSAPPHTFWEQHLVQADEATDPDSYLFAGVGMYVMFVIALLMGWEGRRSPASRTLAVLALTTVLTCLFLMTVTLDLGGQLSLWYFFHQFVPGANAIRAVVRVCFTVMLFGLIGGLVGTQRFVETNVCSDHWRCLAYLALLLLCAGEQIRLKPESLPRPGIHGPSTELAKELTGADAAFILADPNSASGGVVHEVRCMWASLKANVPVINGYSGRWPENYWLIGAAEPTEIVRYLGESWSGRLLILQLGAPNRKQYFDVDPGPDPVKRWRVASGK